MLKTKNRKGFMQKTGQKLKFCSEIGTDGFMVLNQDELSLLHTALAQGLEKSKTQFFDIHITYPGEDVTLSWPGDAGGEVATFCKEKILSYIS